MGPTGCPGPRLPGGRPPALRCSGGMQSRRSSNSPIPDADHGRSGRPSVPELEVGELIPIEHARSEPAPLAEVSERDLVAHFTRLSHRQFSVDLGAYPLGSCTMKYNPKVCDAVAALPGLAGVHPASAGVVDPGVAGSDGRGGRDTVRDHRYGRRHPATGGRGVGRAHRTAAHASLARRPGGTPAQGDHSRLRPRDQSGLGHPRRVRGGDGAERCPGLCGHGGAGLGTGRGCRRHHVDQPEHPRAVRRGHRRHRRRGAQGRWPPLLRRRQPQRHPGCGPAR